ncbi:hypothetical protein ACFXDH_26845 [Streptomyces sp. NPDC059467]|uniref:hypothetical protein n=1 Tax=Streptomyces sp. NPDC059467 TaxID=3346844 RepID=UPI0036AC3A0F
MKNDDLPGRRFALPLKAASERSRRGYAERVFTPLHQDQDQDQDQAPAGTPCRP